MLKPRNIDSEFGLFWKYESLGKRFIKQSITQKERNRENERWRQRQKLYVKAFC